MATRQDTAGPQATLRTITYRLSTASPKSLPQVAAQVAGLLWSCKELLSSSSTAKQGSAAATTVHRFRTYLSTLLQDRTIEGRWAAVVLVKATIEAGGLEVLSKSNGWVKNLLGILKRPDPPTTRILATINLIRIFMLTWDHSNLVRETTTPALPGFVATCLSNANHQRCSSAELHTTLEAFATLLPRHPTIFRTNETQIRALLTRILSSGSINVSESHYSAEHQDVARRVLVLLHHCSPKQGAGAKWDETLKATITATHATCDRVFRSVVENWQSSSGVQPSVNANVLLQGEAQMEVDDAAGLHGWTGIFAGSERLISLLGILEADMETETSGVVTVRVGAVLDLVSRILNLRIPSAKHGSATLNHQVSKDERDALYVNLPSVHVAAIALVQSLLQRFGKAATSTVQTLLGEVTWLFATESTELDVRTGIYSVTSNILELQGSSLTKDDVIDIESIIKKCCEDLLPIGQHGSTQILMVNAGDIGTQQANTASSHATRHAKLDVAAKALLRNCFAKLYPPHIPGRLRTLMERTAVLTQDKEALVSCVLNPAVSSNRSKVQPSLLPLLAQQHANAAEVEAILRPRMPVVRTGRKQADEDELEEDKYEADDHAEEDVTVIDDNAEADAQGGADQQAIEPTADLLAALVQQDAAADSEDLYSVSPQIIAKTRQEEAVVLGITSEKRRAEEFPTETGAQKRAKTNAVEEGSPGHGEVQATTISEHPPSSFVTAPEPSQQVVAETKTVSSTAVTNTVDMGSDDSDFEMPPLTMEQDTEDEDDEGEE
ncbi:hypothetical protein LTR78_003747 [Recurvomyces mirabilis]|uniref:Pre-rRNA-processing protein RIX1 n=1 Tax=Recurvomyces mirabilis TaxID=574656 RepID=A0AAE0WRA1_9PEZI|nr:hypothetical protein LTR78_003747 [Recurvomyces mirabilis]KAK5154859.1 hypothetical protein LTS14_006440 [Recurvomyces mirabilis]